jgi:hypothetical protein
VDTRHESAWGELYAPLSPHRIPSESRLFWSAFAESVASLANPWGALNDPGPWYAGFAVDRDALRRSFWDATISYTISPEGPEEVPGQERLFETHEDFGS